MWDKLIAGGWLMAPLMVCSVMALAIIIERAWHLRLNKLAPDGLIQELTALGHRFTQERLEVIKKSSLEGALFATVIGLKETNTGRLKFRLESDAKLILGGLERYLPILATIATVAPLMGLLGTVTGMIDIFDALGQSGPSQAPALASGIGKALLTTAYGLLIAIPAIVFHRYFTHQLEALDARFERDIEHYCLWFQRSLDNVPTKS